MLPVARAHAAREGAAGTVEAVRGDAFAQLASQRRALTPAAALFVGEQVSTSAQSALAMRLGAATQVRLGAETNLTIDRYLVDVGGILVLGQGAMVFDRDEAAAKAPLAVRSPFGLIAVRGTRFFAGPSNGVFGVFVARGLVLVVGPSTAVEVGPGNGTDIAAPGAEPSPVHPWGKSRIDAAFASVG